MSEQLIVKDEILEIGDFLLIKDGQMYYKASIDFASQSKKVIKD